MNKITLSLILTTLITTTNAMDIRVAEKEQMKPFAYSPHVLMPTANKLLITNAPHQPSAGL